MVVKKMGSREELSEIDGKKRGIGVKIMGRRE